MSVYPANPLQITIHPPIENADLPAAKQGTFWSGDGPTFKDVLDTINPLQHIPIVSSLYESLTGDVQSPAAKLAGGALFGGPIGFFGAVFDSMIKSATGADTGGNILAALQGNDVPAMHTMDNVSATEPAFLSANQRASYNAYVHTQQLTA